MVKVVCKGCPPEASNEGLKNAGGCNHIATPPLRKRHPGVTVFDAMCGPKDAQPC
jgi:hypothetical protein